MRAANKQSGAVLVELALLMLPLLLLVFGITEYGRAVYQYNTLAKGVRDGARFLSQYEPGHADRILQARSLVVCGKTDCDASDPLVPGISLSNVAVRDRTSDPTLNLQSTGRGVVNLVRIEVSGFTFRSAVSAIVPDVTFGPIQATMVQAP